MMINLLFLILLSGTVRAPLQNAVLTLDEGDYVYARLSPDGSRLAVGRALVRDDGAETTDVILVDISSRTSRELIGREKAQEYETYETYLLGLTWSGNDTVIVSLSDGDVGATDLYVQVDSGEIIRTRQSEDEWVPVEFADLVRDAAYYSDFFTEEELLQSLYSNAIRIDDESVLLLVGRGDSTPRLFLIDSRQATVSGFADITDRSALSDAIAVKGQILYLLSGEGAIEVGSFSGTPQRPHVRWESDSQSTCSRFAPVGDRLFVFVRPCARAEAVRGELWEITGTEAVLQESLGCLDELSASADGSRIAVGLWADGRRIIKILEGSVLEPAANGTGEQTAETCGPTN